MDSMNMWIVGTVAIAISGIGFAVRGVKKRKAGQLFAEREALTDGDIYQRFYASSGYAQNDVAEFWHEIAHTLHVPPEKMRPSDKFGKDIGVYWVTSEDLDSLSELAEQRAKQQGIAVDLASIVTVDGYVRCFAKKG